MKNKIKLLRVEHEMKQDDLAKKVGVRRETILHLEGNRYMPSLKLARDIAKVFGKNIEDVFIFTEEDD